MDANQDESFMVRHKAWLLVILVVGFGLLAAGCKKDPKTAFIQGAWYYKDAHLANIPSESAQSTTWEFDNGYFSVASCCFVEMYFSGYYNVVERQENKLNLELFNLKGQYGDMVLHRDDTLYLEIQLDIQADTLKINSGGPYQRVTP